MIPAPSEADLERPIESEYQWVSILPHAWMALPWIRRTHRTELLLKQAESDNAALRALLRDIRNHLDRCYDGPGFTSAELWIKIDAALEGGRCRNW